MVNGRKGAYSFYGVVFTVLSREVGLTQEEWWLEET